MTTYKDAGVNIEATDALTEGISSYSKKTSRIGEMSEIGGFAGIFDLKKCGYRVIESQLIKTDHPHEDYRFIYILAEKN